MILNIILGLTGVAAIASIVNLLDGKKKDKTIPMKVQLPGNMPIISLSNNGNVFNFIVDSGSNISHICKEYVNSIDWIYIDDTPSSTVKGLGANNSISVIGKSSFKDVASREYKIHLSVSNELYDVAKNIEEVTGVKIHGLLGTDFLKNYNCILNFKSLKIYPE